METARALFASCVGFSCIAAVTWFFSSRPRLFVRVFVPHDELRGAARVFLRDPRFCRGMRLMSVLQFAVGGLFGLVGLYLWTLTLTG